MFTILAAAIEGELSRDGEETFDFFGQSHFFALMRTLLEADDDLYWH